jgi:hypothetical protein
VDYYPKVDLSGKIIKIYEPYEVFVFFEHKLDEYRKRLECDNPEASATCANRYAYKHIAIAQAFVKERIQDNVDAERGRHQRGYVTFDMLWLLYKPGSDCYLDIHNVGEHEPFVVSNVAFDFTNGTTNSYEISYWDIDADSNYVGPCMVSNTIGRFAGEKNITTLRGFPCEYLHFMKDVDEGSLKDIRNHFVNRGKKWYGLRRKRRCVLFDGFTASFPRRSVSSVLSSTIVLAIVLK